MSYQLDERCRNLTLSSIDQRDVVPPKVRTKVKKAGNKMCEGMTGPQTYTGRPATHGSGQVVIEDIYDEDNKQVEGFSDASVSTLRNSYPLKLMVPSKASTSSCKWIYPVNFGGGLVGGDSIDLSLHIKRNCCALLTGQESTKVYHCEAGHQSSQTVTGTVADHAFLCVLSDPVVCYKDADFVQKQEFHMSCHGNLVYLDWLIGGRVALGELWEFTSYGNKTDVYIDDTLVYRDNYKLHNAGIVNVRDTMRAYQVIGSCILLGEKMVTAVENLTTILGRKKDLGERYDPELTCSISPLCYSVNQSNVRGAYIRFMASSSRKAYDSVVSYIVEELREMLGGNPFEDKY